MPAGGFDQLSETVVQTIREPLLILDQDLRVRDGNRAFYRSFGTEAEDTVGRSLFDVGGGPWDIADLRELLQEVLPRGDAVENFEVERHFPGLGTRFLQLSAQRLEREEAGEELILLAIRDMTERRRMEEELERSNQELERFAYVASHDLQEPLRMVASYTRLLARRYEGELDERADKYIRYAADGAERMKALIQGLLAYSRVSSQGEELVPVHTDDVLEAALRDLRMRIHQTGGHVTRDPLPVALADPDQLRQVFQNLIENALKFSGEAPPVVHISGHRDGPRCVFAVRDEGVGVEPESAERMFVIFQRLHGRDVEGTGIGLALCKRIIERHGGELWVESSPGEGATFRFTIPSSEAT